MQIYAFTTFVTANGYLKRLHAAENWAGTVPAGIFFKGKCDIFSAVAT